MAESYRLEFHGCLGSEGAPSAPTQRLDTQLIFRMILLTATAAHAEPMLVPMPERGGSCPHGFFRSGGFCVPSAGAQDAIPQRNGNCPHGWTASGSFCFRSGRR